MSGLNRMNEWERYWESNRENIEKMFGSVSERSREVRQMSNHQLAKSLYKMLLKGELDEVLVMESAERHGAAGELTTEKLGEN